MASDHLDPMARWRQRLAVTAAKPTHHASERERQDRLERPRTVAQAAEELGLSVHTIRAWVAERRLAHLRLGRAIRIPAAEIRRVIEQATVPAVDEHGG